jgi:hypothetical protein
VFVSVDFNSFCVAIPARLIAHGFRGAFFMVTINREIRRIQTGSAGFFTFIPAPRRIRQPAVQSKEGDQPARPNLSRNNQLLKSEGVRNDRTRPQRGPGSNTDQGYR